LKKLVLHIGYPKTASTTLQESIFLNLHHKGLINFLGRTVTSTHKSRNIQKFNQDWVVDIRKNFTRNIPLPKRDYVLSDELINVLSDEELTMPAFLNEANYGSPINPLELTGVLKTVFKEADEIIILLSIRNQASLIPSLFIQKYRFIYKYFPGKSFDDFIFSKPGVVRQDVYNAFDFLNIVDTYTRNLGAKIIPLIFEDLNSDLQQYSEQISSLIGVSTDVVKEQLKSNHLRNKKIYKNAKPVTVLMPNFIGRLLEFSIGKSRARNFFTFRWYYKSSLYYNLEKKLFMKRVLIDSPTISENSKADIKAAFVQSNLEFCRFYSLDIEKFKKYNYI
jgi:hypothetical protein